LSTEIVPNTQTLRLHAKPSAQFASEAQLVLQLVAFLQAKWLAQAAVWFALKLPAPSQLPVPSVLPEHEAVVVVG
jgi:hypothetical protein